VIRNIVFGGCSITWGQSLHYHANFNDDIHPRDGFFYEDLIKSWHYQYMVDNRFSTKVADYFGRKAIVNARNGGSNLQISEGIWNNVNEYTDLILIQTTNFSRGNNKIKEQIDSFLDIIEKFEKKNILVRFIHWDIKYINFPEKILDRTIYINNEISFSNLIFNKKSKLTIKYSFGFEDYHFNQQGHDFMASEIIKYLSDYLEIPKYKKTLKNNIKNRLI